MLLYMDDKFLLHNTGRHPECAERLEHIQAGLKRSGLLERVTQVPISRASDADLL